MLFGLSILLPLHIAAQEPAERVFLDSLLDRLGRANSVAALPPKTQCAIRWSTDLARLCEGLVVERRAELTGSKDDALVADALMLRAVAEKPNWATGWYGLGVTRLQLGRLNVVSHEGPLLTAGVSNEAGSANALVHALELDPDLSIAAEALATAPERPEGSSALKERVAMLRRVRKALSPVALAATAILERDAGSVDSAIALERRALASGKVDSGVVLLSLARDLYRIGAPNEGRNALIMGAATATPAAQHAYRDELAWIASPQELKEWDALPAAERSNWIANFWAKRDITEGRKDGERLIEHYRRIEYAMANFRLSIPQVGRQRSLTFTPSDEFKGEAEALKYAQHNPEQCPDAARLATDAETLGADSPFPYYHPIQNLIDDRGAVWIRHGKPTKMASSVSSEAVEIWRYDRPNGPLILQFREADFMGSVGANTLVPTLLTISPGIRNQVCSVDSSLCSDFPRFDNVEPSDRFTVPSNAKTCSDKVARQLDAIINSEGNRLSEEAIVHARDAGRTAIDLAITTDSYHRDFTHTVTPSVQIYGLDRATGGAPRLVVAFAIPGEQLEHAVSAAAGGRTVYPIRLQVMAANSKDGRRTDSDTTRLFATSAPLVKGQFLTGVAELPLPPGAYGASVVLTQDDGRGAIAHLGEVTIPGSVPKLAVSDLVLGREESGVRWNSGTTLVPLNPLNTFPNGTEAEVYFQLSGLQVGQSYSSRYEIFGANDDPKRPPRLALSFTQVAQQERMEVVRTVGLKNLEPGKYRIRLTVTGDGATTTSEARLTILK